MFATECSNPVATNSATGPMSARILSVVVRPENAAHTARHQAIATYLAYRRAGGGSQNPAIGLFANVARALIELDETDRPAMKKSGFLTRDARATERKKYGLKKARKAPQYSKR